MEKQLVGQDSEDFRAVIYIASANEREGVPKAACCRVPSEDPGGRGSARRPLAALRCRSPLRRVTPPAPADTAAASPRPERAAVRRRPWAGCPGQVCVLCRRDVEPRRASVGQAGLRHHAPTSQLGGKKKPLPGTATARWVFPLNHTVTNTPRCPAFAPFSQKPKLLAQPATLTQLHGAEAEPRLRSPRRRIPRRALRSRRDTEKSWNLQNKSFPKPSVVFPVNLVLCFMPSALKTPGWWRSRTGKVLQQPLAWLPTGQDSFITS